MNQEALVELVTYAQAGDANAMEQLLFWAYTPVSFLCQKLLKDSYIAQEHTREILTAISHKLHTLQSPAMIEKWVVRITAARCIQVQRKNRWMEEAESPEEELPIIGEELDEMQTVDAVQKMVDMLPGKARTCMTLHCCCEMNSSSIAQLTGYTVEDVRQNMGVAQSFILEQLQKYQDLGTQFYPITSLTDVLQSGMRHEREEEAMAVVYGVLGKEMPKPVDPDRGKKILLWILIVILALVIVLLGVLNLVVKKKNTFSPEDYSPAVVTVPTVPTEPTEPEETTEPTIAETTEATEETEETVPETTAETEPEEIKPAAANTENKEEKAPSTTGTSTQTPSAGNSSTLGPGKEVPSAAPATGEDGHTHRYLTTKSNINCEKGGTRRYECADCDYYYTEEIAPTGSHNLITVPNAAAAGNATCTSPGKAYKICTKCNFAAIVDDPSKPALGHDYTSTVVAPTATEQGYTLHKCSRCGDSYKDTYVDALAPAQTEAATPPTDAATPPEGENGDTGEA